MLEGSVWEHLEAAPFCPGSKRLSGVLPARQWGGERRARCCLWLPRG